MLIKAISAIRYEYTDLSTIIVEIRVEKLSLIKLEKSENFSSILIQYVTNRYDITWMLHHIFMYSNKGILQLLKIMMPPSNPCTQSPPIQLYEQTEQ